MEAELGKLDQEQEKALRERLGRELHAILTAMGVSVGAHWASLGAAVKRACAGGLA